MQGKSNKPRWALVGTSVILLLCFIGVLLFRGVVLGLYQVDVLSTAQISAVLCYSIAFPTALGIVWLIYRQSFIGVTYSDLQHRALRLQAWGFVACVLTVLLLVITLQSSFILVLSI